MKVRLTVLMALSLVFATLILHQVLSFKPVILVHGIFSHGSAFVDLENSIKAAHPGTNVTSLDIYDDLYSVEPMWLQLPAFIDKVTPIMQQAANGVHLVCHSQGKNNC